VLMPLYQKGLKRTQTFHIAFLLDRFLTLLTGRAKNRRVPFGKVLSSEEVKQKFPLVNSKGLKGGALWYDAAVPDSQRYITELLCRVNNCGAVTLNYMKASQITRSNGSVTGVSARDQLTGSQYTFKSDVIVNSAGPWIREIAEQFGIPEPDMYPPSLMWNVLFDREALSESALGVSSFVNDGQIYFLHPWKGRLLVGTGHASRASIKDNPEPTSEEIDQFIRGLNDAIPELDLSSDEILHIYSGYVSVKADDNLDLIKNDALIDHSQKDGPVGLFSLQGTKFTAARATAEMVIDQVFAKTSLKDDMHCNGTDDSLQWEYSYNWYPGHSEEEWKKNLQSIIQNESVIHLDDLILRRTTLGDNPERAIKLAPSIADLFEWDEERKEQEIHRIHEYFHWFKVSTDRT
ncbi:MAG: FAD-dependent oxidoreductase, partial [Candidatus Marinimicrobia bacterium]|nr:FAD-dependent oxidoreductase [Candidatus Neomarinimicrobiota bacterium]